MPLVPYSFTCKELALLKQGEYMEIKIGMNEKAIRKLAMDTFFSLKRFGSNPETTYADCLEMAIYHLYPHASN
jgi:hypothetical protein